MKIPGVTFSLKRAVGITKVKQKVARKTGLPLTKQGLERKIGGAILKKLTKATAVTLMLGTVAGCSNAKQSKYERQCVKSEIERVEDILDELGSTLYSIDGESDPNAVANLLQEVSSLEISDLGYELSPEQEAMIKGMKEEIEKLQAKTNEVCADFFSNYSKTVANGEVLVEDQHVIPVYLKRGMQFNITCESDGPVTVNLYNSDSRKIVKSYKTGNINEMITIANSAIYLFEINAKTPQYCYLNLSYTSDSFEDYVNSPQIKVEQVECGAGSFRAKKIPGIKLRPVFEEPHKITIRSKGKNLWDMSSPYRSVTAVRIPAGSSDILYHLRISTSDSDSSHDGQFCDDVDKAYRKIKFLGLPLYESSKSSNNIYRELLSDLYVSREEKAYCNFYVFNNQSQAKKFQDNANISGLSYNMDYSCSGTQSRNERIPVKGMSTIYLGFENPREFHDVYIWLEVMATVPTDVYYNEVYTLSN